jgi:TrmH family RNA methyltransferase
MRIVTSLQNPIVKLIRSLDRRKHRKESGLFVAEGAKVLARAKTEGWEPDYVLSTDIQPAWGKAEILKVTPEAMNAVSGQSNATDVLGVFKQRFQREIVAGAAGEIWVALENIRDPGNLGAIIRTADAVGAKGVVLVGQSCDPYSREAVRASMGSIFGIALHRMEQSEFLSLSAEWPGDSVATAADATQGFRRRYRGPVLLVMGSEGAGLSAETAEVCRVKVAIPMPGGAESLNVAVATGIMLYEISRRG